ncbi:hypothetical protein COV17_01345 [Candidatus Woesearchaeota archaeon CG10_big_fil_rev_8_21_14_0_10_36_11]|nr:MAG: hypothetical protein COV17_01345 [Candidatus Woesearchaeota archaeon CG10_big_fil_rev_8_21_14_0_10_36_11]
MISLKKDEVVISFTIHIRSSTQNFIKFDVFGTSMGAKSKKKDRTKNKRLDLLFRDIETEEKRKIIENVESLTFETIQGLSKPHLRLKK